MPFTLNEKLKDLQPYDPIEGEYPIRLDANESFLEMPMELLEQAQYAMADIPFNRYPDPYAKELCTSFGTYYGVDPSLVTAGNGSDELISIIETAFLMKGNAILTVAPDFSMYRFYSSLVEAKSVVYQKGEDLTIDVDELIFAANNSGAKLLLFSNPCNPTSLGLKREEVRRLVRSVSALVVLDEAYMDFWDQSLLSEVEQYDNLIILRTCSKAFGMAGIRLGFAVANPILTRALRAVKSPYNVNSVTQKVGTIILNSGEVLDQAIAELIGARKALYQAVKELETAFPEKLHVYDSCTNFVLVRLPNARRVFDALLEKGIAVRFMGDTLRITAGSPEENERFLENFKELLSSSTNL